MESEIKRILAMTDDELRAEAEAEGRDIDAEAEEMARQFDVIARLVKERDYAQKLMAAAWARNATHTKHLRYLLSLIERAAAHLPGNPDAAEAILSEVRAMPFTLKDAGH